MQPRNYHSLEFLSAELLGIICFQWSGYTMARNSQKEKTATTTMSYAVIAMAAEQSSIARSSSNINSSSNNYLSTITITTTINRICWMPVGMLG